MQPNALKSLSSLKNQYFALRHGESVSNVLHLIISDPQNGLSDEYGLTQVGQEQTRHSIMEAIQTHVLDANTIIYSSDFSRAFQTAQIAQKLLKCPAVIPEIRLRERFFGTFEKTPNSNYAHVWEMDDVSPDTSEHGVESANAVLSRVTSVVLDCEKQYSGKNIVLVSHGDTLQILQAGFEKKKASDHRKLPHLEKGELRKLEIQKHEV